MDWLRELGALADITKSARSRIFEKVEKRREDLRRRKIIELKPPPPPPLIVTHDLILNSTYHDCGLIECVVL